MFKKVLFFIFALILLISALSLESRGQQVDIYKLSDCLVSGSYSNIEVKGDYAFIATGYGFKILDVSNPSSPQEIVHLPTEGLTQNISVEDDYLILCDALGGIQVYNISDIDDPEYVSALNTPGWARTVCKYGNYLYAATEDFGVQIISFSNPYNLELVDILYTGGEACNLAFLDNWMYVALGIAGLGIYDITDPEDPVFNLNWNTPGGNAKGLYLFPDEQHLVLTDMSNGTHILNLTFPGIPTWDTTMAQTGLNAADVNGEGTYGIFSYYYSGIRSFNAQGTIYDSLNVEAAISLDVEDGYCYICKGGKGFDIVDCYPPQNLYLYESFPDSGEPFKLTAMDGILYVGDRSGGLCVVDATDPFNPELIERIDTGHWALDVMLSPDSSYLYVADFGVGIQVYSLSDPLHPQWLNTVSQSPDTGAHGFAYNDGYLYLALFYGGLQVFSLSNPALPVLVNSLDTPSPYRELAISADGNNLYACAEENGILVYIIYSPDSIVVVDTLTMFERPYDIAINGDYAYVADWSEGFFTVDISNFAYIFKVDSIGAEDAISGVSLINNNYVAICDWTAGMAVVNVSDPLDIFIADRTETPGYAWNTHFDGTFLYLADDYDLSIYDIFNVGVSGGGEKALSDYGLTVGAYPNPFNNSTRLNFRVGREGRVRLSIYNLKGEEVAVVVDEYYQVGNYTEDFKAQGLSSGIYFAYLQEGDKSAAQKLMLLK